MAEPRRIDMTDVARLRNLSDEEIMHELTRRGIPVGESRGDDEASGSFDRLSATSDYCERCGAEKPSGIQYTGRRYCTCGAKFRATSAAIPEIDIDGHMTFERIDEESDPSVVRVARTLREIATGERSLGVFMFGLPGRGKTHLQVATARLCIQEDRLVGVYSLASLVGRIQETYGYSDSGETKSKIIDEVASHEVVILDDIGKEHRSADTESIVYQLVDSLYRKKRTLIASSNLPAEPFVSRYDGAVLSRFGGLCQKVVIKGEDRREKEWSW